MTKRIETAYKANIKRLQRNKLSSIEPEAYATRFLDFMQSEVFKTDLAAI